MVRNSILATLLLLVLLALLQAFYGGTPDDAPAQDGFEVIAHRGVHTNWVAGAYDPVTGCEATHIYTPTHSYIENTLESIGAAFELGATIVEIDIRPSSDGHLVVFHDDRLECRTDGSGAVSDQPLAYLKGLDIGYGYTHDGGLNYPFRGQGIGKMPTLVEVLQAFPDRTFWIDHKDGNVQTAELLVDVLKSLPPEQQARVYYWGPDETYDYVHGEVPAVTRLLGLRDHIKTCFLPYVLTLGLAGFPEECRGVGIALPPEYTRAAWGWPYRFLRSVDRAGLRFYLLIDNEQDAQAFQGIPVDGIITDYVEVVGRYYAGR